MYNENTYWITLSQIDNFGPKKIFEINNILNELKISIEDLYNASESYLSTLNFSKSEIEKIINSKNNLGNNAFLYEKLLDEGFEVYSFLDENYPRY